MSNFNDGGPAFPRDHASDGHNGMTLRDYFAAVTLTGTQGDVAARKWDREQHAEYAYKMADAMLKAREVKP